MKRVWGRIKYDSAPSITTLNTLASFADYENWRSFKSSAPTLAVPIGKESTRKIPNLGVIVGSAAFLTLLFISLFSMIGPGTDKFQEWDATSVQFSSRPLAVGLPNSVVFNLDLGGYRSDDIKIQQFWDPNKTIEIHNGQNQATGIYYYPGYFHAKLMVENKILREHDLFIKSEGLLAMIEYGDIPKYQTNKSDFFDTLQFSQKFITEISQAEKAVVSSFHFVADLDSISGDNFIFKAQIKNQFRDKWAVCQSTRLVVLGTEGAFIIPFSIPGCVSDLFLLLNDTRMNGKKQDMSAFGADFSQNRKVSLTVVDKEMTLSLDGHSVYRGTYHKSMGRLVGFRFKFTGVGEVIIDELTGSING